MYLLFDIGGTNMRMAVSDSQKITNSTIVSTPKDFTDGIKAFKNFAQKFEITGISGGIAGPLDRKKTQLLASPHIPGWIGKPLRNELKNAFGCKVILENDCVLTALGGATRGVGEGYRVVAYLGIGTGIGGARIVNKKVDENAFGFEPGHQIIVPNGNPCNCGGTGHLEAYVGGLYIEKIYGQKAENIKDPKIWDELARHLAIGLNNTIVHWSPDIVILGGSVMKSLPLDKVKEHLYKILTIFPNKPKLALATLGHKAGFYGALELLK